MKKLFYIMSICALALISCQKEEIADNNPIKGGFTYTFVGTHAAEVKASSGDKNDQNKWPILWEEGDKLGVYDAAGNLVGAAELAAESAGQNQGTFTVTANRELAEGEALTLKYPYSEGEAFVPTKQTQLAVSSSAGLGANAVATAATTFSAEGTSFTLSHANAYLRFELTSEEFKDYTLNGVTLWCKGENLSGAVGAEQDYVKATLSEPVVLGTDAKYIWMTTNNVDLTNKDFYAIIHMTKGIETVTLPVSLKGKGELKAHAVTSLKLPKLVKSLAPAWYEPIETRYIAAYGEGWCYGPENTVIFTDRTTAKSVDLKARGNFMKVKEPKYVEVAYLSGINELNYGTVTINDVDASSFVRTSLGNNKYDLAETFVDVEISGAAASIKLNVSRTLGAGNEAGYITGLKVKDSEKNVIWGINLWHRMKDKDDIPTVQYNNGEVTDRNLGVDEKGDAKTWRASGSFFQWGRPFAIQSQFNAYSKRYFVSKPADEVTSLEVSAANPFTLYYYADGAENLDWYYGTGSSGRENDLDDLWGNPNTGTTTNVYERGTKSIYDPCPKGYMVVCPTILKEVEDNYKTDGTGATTLNGTDTSYPYFTYKGIHWGFACGYLSAKSISWKTTFCGYWSNSHIGNSGHARSMEWASKDATSWGRSRSKAAAFPVRCMVDTENR